MLENQGIGYEIRIPFSSSVYLAAPDETVIVYTYMAVREDAVELYGFDDNESLEMFMLLTTVSGIGSKAALSILSTLSVQEIRKAVVFDDQNALVRAQGIGKKSASRIILELKDRIKESSLEDEPGDGNAGTFSSEAVSAFEDAVSALMSLGYTRGEAAGAVSAVRREEASAEELIKEALRKLSRI